MFIEIDISEDIWDNQNTSILFNINSTIERSDPHRSESGRIVPVGQFKSVIAEIDGFAGWRSRGYGN